MKSEATSRDLSVPVPRPRMAGGGAPPGDGAHWVRRSGEGGRPGLEPRPCLPMEASQRLGRACCPGRGWGGSKEG